MEVRNGEGTKGYKFWRDKSIKRPAIRRGKILSRELFSLIFLDSGMT